MFFINTYSIYHSVIIVLYGYLLLYEIKAFIVNPVNKQVL